MNWKACIIATLILTPAVSSADVKAKPADTQKSNLAKLDTDDMKLVSYAKHVNAMETDMGRLAKSNGTPAVKKYGDLLIEDHTRNTTKLVALAKKKGVTKIPDAVPTTEAEKAEHQQTMDDMAKLKTLKGADFDKQFLTMMVAGHDKEVVRFAEGAKAAKDKDLASFLNDTVPVIQSHADAARELQTTTGVSMR